jgi:hypothetical protein
VPYTVTVVNSATKTGLVYIGLSRTDPTLSFLSSAGSTQKSATVSGSVTGGTGFPQPANHVTNVAFISPETNASNTVNATSGAYSMTGYWTGASTTVGTMYALQQQNDASTGLPVAYKGFGTKTSVSLTDAGTFANQNIALSTVTTATLSGTVSAQSGYTLSSRGLGIVFGTGGFYVATDNSVPATPASTSFTFLTPVISGATFRLYCNASKTGSFVIASKTGLAGNASGISVTLPAAPEYSLPVASATGVTTTTDFSWTSMPNAVYILEFRGPTGQPTYDVVTSSTTVKIPDLSSLGLGLPKATAYSWVINAIAPTANMDASASSLGVLGPYSGKTVSDFFLAITGSSSPRTFTTAP